MGRKFTIPILVAFPLLAVGAHVAMFPGDLRDKTNEGSRIFTGYDLKDGSFDWRRMSFGLLPLLVGLAASKFLGTELGLNRMLGAKRIPLIRL